jgi:hypothetical protein
LPSLSYRLLYASILTQDLGYVLLHSTLAGKTGNSREEEQIEAHLS